MNLVTDAKETVNKFVILGHKNLHSGFVHGVISNGGEMPLTDNISVAVVKLNNNYLNLQIRIYDEGKAPKKQSFVRTKTVKEIVEVEKKSQPQELIFEQSENKKEW